jgi:hypothetical protein
MTGLAVHQCPKCELRFSFRSEMEQHLREDHPRPAIVERTPVTEVDGTLEPAGLPAAPPVTAPVAEARHKRVWSRARVPAVLLLIVGVLLVAYVAVFVSSSSAVIVAAAVLMLSLIYLRRLHGQARVPRR